MSGGGGGGGGGMMRSHKLKWSWSIKMIRFEREKIATTFWSWWLYYALELVNR